MPGRHLINVAVSRMFPAAPQHLINVTANLQHSESFCWNPDYVQLRTSRALIVRRKSEGLDDMICDLDSEFCRRYRSLTSNLLRSGLTSKRRAMTRGERFSVDASGRSGVSEGPSTNSSAGDYTGTEPTTDRRVFGRSDRSGTQIATRKLLVPDSYVVDDPARNSERGTTCSVHDCCTW
jgi:hypothetical protein